MASHRFDEFDEFRAQLRGWDTHPVQIDPGPLQLDLQFIDLDDVRISRLSVNRRIIDSSYVEPGWTSFVVPLNPQAGKSWCGIEVAPGSLVHIAAGRECRSVLQPGWESLEFSMRTELIADVAPGIALESSPERSVWRLAPGSRAEFRKWADQLFGRDACGRIPLGLRSESMRLLLGVLQGPADQVGLARTRRYQLAAEALERFGDQSVRVDALARELFTTPRNLQYAFRSILGVSPARYDLARRLTRARQALRAALPNTTVSRVAGTYGFNHLGRFAEQYRRHFGEPPSATLSVRRSAVIRSQSG